EVGGTRPNRRECTKCNIELIANFHYAQQVDEKSRKIFQDFVLPGSRPKGIYSEESGRAWCFHGRSSRFRRKLFHGRRYLAQIEGASRTAPCETAIRYRDGP